VGPVVKINEEKDFCVEFFWSNILMITRFLQGLGHPRFNSILFIKMDRSWCKKEPEMFFLI
jgi:hypothetical protein